MDFYERIISDRKNKNRIDNNRDKEPSPVFRIDFRNNFAVLNIVNKDGTDGKFDYRHYKSPIRDVLKAVDNIQKKQLFCVDWSNPFNDIFFSENESLIFILEKCGNIVGPSGKAVKFADEPAKLILRITGEDPVQSEVVCRLNGKEFIDFKFLIENKIFLNDTIISVQPVGENFLQLSSFNISTKKNDLQKFLSLFYSLFDNIAVEYGEYTESRGEDIHSQVALIFESVDKDNSLYMRIATSIHGYPATFLDELEISKVVYFDELEKRIVVNSVRFENVEGYFDYISSVLNTHKTSLRKNGVKRNDYYTDTNLIIVEEELAKVFIYYELLKLPASFAVYGAEKLKSYKLIVSRPSLKVSMSHGINFLEGDVSITIENENFSLFEMLNQYRKNSYVKLSDGSKALIDPEYMKKLERIFKKKEDRVKISFFDLPLVEDLINEKIIDENFTRAKEIFDGFNRIKEEEFDIPLINVKLRHYQEDGYKWLRYLDKHSFGGCLADDMGLGKTAQAIALLSFLYSKEEKPSLIVMPRTLVFNWENEIEKVNPGLSYYVHYGSSRNLNDAKGKNLILTTYATLRIDIQEFQKIEFCYVILDESQSIKNIHSQASKAVMLLTSRGRLALSGTPIENNLGELYSLFRFLNPGMFGSFEDFNDDYAVPIQKEQDASAARELKIKIYPFLLRRLKRDVLKELPEKIEQSLVVEMEDGHKKLYEERRIFYHNSLRREIAKSGINKTQFFIFQALTELRQIASIPESKTGGGIISPKRELLIGNLRDIVATGHKALVFANFLDALDVIAEDLDEEKIEYLMMTGATKDRKTLVEKFQTDDKYKIFLMTLKTGGVGVNLTRADYVFIFDPWWNKAAEDQAIDRTHRIGQDKTVFTYKMVTKGTIEEKILELQKRKMELFENFISADSAGASLKAITEEDIDFIFS
ncbi:helicase/SNF2 domain-containing protein [Candidatus Omnitrophus magneticus]|uniref:Helicase/SNF2 domain-containing protein n=1 Tax=Candidatus Omnitrophus magneticus TaxID=1609969 RepID=A0A0F0CJ27_9BACT|nr:helicase/SNF2 domain-containing protein [Candidatus Omnitrophus magneticus]